MSLKQHFEDRDPFTVDGAIAYAADVLVNAVDPCDAMHEALVEGGWL